MIDLNRMWKTGISHVCRKCNGLCTVYESHSQYLGSTLLSECCRARVRDIDFTGFPK